ncbi:isocyanide synthase family protein [Streptomyces sp. RKND-216]|uniref:L-tyrosine/L-tryptophan isonitrile synthase family protein n=1 Tax=Streptomyces sp. RKND-216 TaxID=2562581 RepID=UPI0014457007|nr:isocyanide synthase family protein [Streptomyces sp. RKND-216]
MNPEEISARILRIVFRHRRGAPEPGCDAETCPRCVPAHLPAVRASVRAGVPVECVLPGFPCKSPNPAKVLGTLPDRAEEVAFDFLAGLCRQVREVYPPGMRLVICSDGRVFSDLIGVHDEVVTAYQDEIRRMLARRRPAPLSLFSIDDVPGMDSCSYDAMRRALDETHGERPERIREEVRAGGEALDLYRALTRFLLEDSFTPGVSRTRSALQREARRRAYGVIARSRAWGGLVAEHFPRAVRLSIHPQRCGSAKFGIRLTPEDDGWLTPWHAVAVESGDGYVLRRRADTERDGARLVHREGRPSHFVRALPDTPPSVTGGPEALHGPSPLTRAPGAA